MTGKIPKIMIRGAEGACTLLNEAILSVCNFEGSGEIQVSESAGGRRIQKAGDGKRMVQLTNNANPYTGVEVYATPSGGWATYPNSLMFTGVYEDNLQSGLLNQVVEIEPGYRNDWRFRFRRIGSGDDPCHGTAFIQVALTVFGGCLHVPVANAFPVTASCSAGSVTFNTPADTGSILIIPHVPPGVHAVTYTPADTCHFNVLTAFATITFPGCNDPTVGVNLSCCDASPPPPGCWHTCPGHGSTQFCGDCP